MKAFELREAQTTFKGTFDSLLREENVDILERVINQLVEIIPFFQPSPDEDSFDERLQIRENLNFKFKDNSKWREYRESETNKSGQVSLINNKAMNIQPLFRVQKLVQRKALIRNLISRT